MDWNDYRYVVIPGSRLAAISTSRGCTFGCTFCSQQKFWKKIWRKRKPFAVVDEMAVLKNTYGANVFLIVDEYRTSDRRSMHLIMSNSFLTNLIRQSEASKECAFMHERVARTFMNKAVESLEEQLPRIC